MQPYPFHDIKLEYEHNKLTSSINTMKSLYWERGMDIFHMKNRLAKKYKKQESDSDNEEPILSSTTIADDSSE